MDTITFYELAVSTLEHEQAQRQAEIDSVLATVGAKLEVINNAYAARLAELELDVKTTKEALEAEVIGGKSTIKGKSVMAVYNKGRVSWDSGKLDGMMSLIPQLADARKVGEPTVTIRKI